MSDTNINALVERWDDDKDDHGRNRFYRQVRKFLHCRCDADEFSSCDCIADPAVTQGDLVGDVVLHLLEKASEYDLAKNDCADAWACKVIQNRLTDSLRASTRQRPDGSKHSVDIPGPTGDTVSTETYNEFERYDHDPEDFYRD